MKTYDVVPMTVREVNAFYKKQDSNNADWSRALLTNLLQVTNGKSNTQQVNRSLNLETTRFKNGNLKQQGQAILAYLKHVIDAHSIGIEWKGDRFQYLESVALDIETVQPFHLWQAEAEAKAEANKAEAKAEADKAEAEVSRLKQEKSEAAKAAKAEKAKAEKAKAEAAKAEKAAAEAKTEAEAEAAKAEAAKALESAKVAEAEAEKAEAEAAEKAAALIAERDRLIAAGGGVQAKSLLVQLQRALLAGITGGYVSQLQDIAKAAGELLIMANSLAMETAAKVDEAAALQLVDVPPSSASRSAGLKKAS